MVHEANQTLALKPYRGLDESEMKIQNFRVIITSHLGKKITFDRENKIGIFICQIHDPLSLTISMSKR